MAGSSRARARGSSCITRTALLLRRFRGGEWQELGLGDSMLFLCLDTGKVHFLIWNTGSRGRSSVTSTSGWVTAATWSRAVSVKSRGSHDWSDGEMKQAQLAFTFASKGLCEELQSGA